MFHRDRDGPKFSFSIPYSLFLPYLMPTPPLDFPKLPSMELLEEDDDDEEDVEDVEEFGAVAVFTPTSMPL